MIGLAVLEAPWGPIHLAADEDGFVALEVMATDDGFAESVQRRMGARPEATAGREVARRVGEAVDAVEAHLAGDPAALQSAAFTLRGVSAWDRLVLDGVRRIAWGEVASYGGVARAIGRPGAARAVGAAVGRNPIGLVIPCHRVIAGDGSLGGYGSSWFGQASALRDVKRQLLALEGTVPAGGHVAWTTFRAPDG